jgi:hypothetical protein
MADDPASRRSIALAVVEEVSSVTAKFYLRGRRLSSHDDPFPSSDLCPDQGQ